MQEFRSRFPLNRILFLEKPFVGFLLQSQYEPGNVPDAKDTWPYNLFKPEASPAEREDCLFAADITVRPKHNVEIYAWPVRRRGGRVLALRPVFPEKAEAAVESP